MPTNSKPSRLFFPPKKRVGALEGYDSGNWLWDPAEAATIPWTFKRADHYLKPPNDTTIVNRDFSTFDSPTNWITDLIAYGGDTVDRNELEMPHVLFFAVRTTQNVNGSADVLTQRLRLNWAVNGTGTYNSANGVWTYGGPGDGVDGDAQWTEIPDGLQVPKPTIGSAFNDLLVSEVWNPSNQ